MRWFKPWLEHSQALFYVVLTDVFVYCYSALRIRPLLYLHLLSVRSFFRKAHATAKREAR